MANNFNNASLICTTGLTDVYTCPANTTAIVILLQADNVTSRADTLTVVWTSGATVTHLCNQTPVPAYQAIGCLTGKLVLKAGDKIRAQCGTYQAIEIAASVLEIS